MSADSETVQWMNEFNDKSNEGESWDVYLIRRQLEKLVAGPLPPGDVEASD